MNTASRIKETLKAYREKWGGFMAETPQEFLKELEYDQAKFNHKRNE